MELRGTWKTDVKSWYEVGVNGMTICEWEVLEGWSARWKTAARASRFDEKAGNSGK